MATGLLESMDYKGGGLLERTHHTSFSLVIPAVNSTGFCRVQFHYQNKNVYHHKKDRFNQASHLYSLRPTLFSMYILPL